MKRYWSVTRTPRYSLLFVLPLFLLYEGLATALADEHTGLVVRNAADVALKTPFLLLSGARGSLVFFATVIAACVFVVWRDIAKSRDKPRLRTFALMVGESAILALLLGLVVGALTQRLLSGLQLSMQVNAPTPLESMGVMTRLMLSLGAGLYEELLFRVLLVGGIAAGIRWLAGGGHQAAAGIVAAVIGALIFSAFHYVGQYGDPLDLASFTYRAIAGLVFSGLYLTRGFGITAWTHALYDVYVMVL